MTSTKKFEVAEVQPDDAGKKKALIDPEGMKTEGIEKGDLVVIEGDSRTVTVAEPRYSHDRKTGIIRIDGNTRRNAGAGIGDKVTLEKTEVREAEQVTLTPTGSMRINGGENYLKRALQNKPLMKGDRFRVRLISSPVSFAVTGTHPDSPVVVTSRTEVSISTDASVSERQGESDERDVPDVSYEDIGGLNDELEQVREMIEMPLRNPDIFEELAIDPPKGVILHGPPGTGKTLIAKAVANASDSNFIAVKGPELMNKYVGESEKAVREVFSEAKQNSPAVIFFDEIDTIAGERDGSSNSEATEKVVSQLLTELDGVEELEDVVVIAASNRPDMIDKAILRPGRLDRKVKVPVPDLEARKEIFRIHLEGTPLEEVDIEELAENTEGFTGSDIESVTREASMLAMRDYMKKNSPEDLEKNMEDLKLTQEYLEKAIEKVGSSLSEEDRKSYDEMAQGVKSMAE